MSTSVGAGYGSKKRRRGRYLQPHVDELSLQRYERQARVGGSVSGRVARALIAEVRRLRTGRIVYDPETPPS